MIKFIEKYLEDFSDKFLENLLVQILNFMSGEIPKGKFDEVLVELLGEIITITPENTCKKYSRGNLRRNS